MQVEWEAVATMLHAVKPVRTIDHTLRNYYAKSVWDDCCTAVGRALADYVPLDEFIRVCEGDKS